VGTNPFRCTTDNVIRDSTVFPMIGVSPQDPCTVVGSPKHCGIDAIFKAGFDLGVAVNPFAGTVLNKCL
jgi:hypothetical protein